MKCYLFITCFITLFSVYGHSAPFDDANRTKSKKDFSDIRTGGYSSVNKSCEHLKQISEKAFKQCISQEEKSSKFIQCFEEECVPK